MLTISQWNWGKKDGTQWQEVLEALKRFKMNDIFLFLVSEILDMITFFDISRPMAHTNSKVCLYNVLCLQKSLKSF